MKGRAETKGEKPWGSQQHLACREPRTVPGALAPASSWDVLGFTDDLPRGCAGAASCSGDFRYPESPGTEVNVTHCWCSSRCAGV